LKKEKTKDDQFAGCSGRSETKLVAASAGAAALDQGICLVGRRIPFIKLDQQLAHNPNRPWGDTPADALLAMADLPKRPRDLNQWQKLLVDLARGVACHKQPRPDKQEKNSVAAARGQAGGLKAGKAHVEKLSAEERLALARKTVQARWNRPLRQNHRPSST